MAVHERPAGAGIRILRAADRAGWGKYFSSEISGNRIVSIDIDGLGSGRLQAVLAKTDGGATFPAQFHTGGMELAVIIVGAGTIEVMEDEVIQEVLDCEAGDVVLIPPQLVYRVCNRHASEPLLAWVFCAEETQFYWTDGSRV